MAKILMTTGLVLFAAGGIIWLLAKVGISIGKLPGDIHIRGETGSFYFPLITCVIISLALTFIVNFISWFFKK